MEGFGKLFGFINPESLTLLQTIWGILTAIFIIAGVVKFVLDSIYYFRGKGKADQMEPHPTTEENLKKKYIQKIIGSAVIATASLGFSAVIALFSLFAKI